MRRSTPADAEKFIQCSNNPEFQSDSAVKLDKTRKSVAMQLRVAIECLMIIDIKLDKEDDAQRILHSFTTGLDLNEGDKIRQLHPHGP